VRSCHIPGETLGEFATQATDHQKQIDDGTKALQSWAIRRVGWRRPGGVLLNGGREDRRRLRRLDPRGLIDADEGLRHLDGAMTAAPPVLSRRDYARGGSQGSKGTFTSPPRPVA